VACLIGVHVRDNHRAAETLGLLPSVGSFDVLEVSACGNAAAAGTATGGVDS
jgi:hypothetical protein